MKNVLVVDDEKSFIMSLRAGMEKHYPDFNVLTAEHGKAASEILESTQVDLVVTDLRMPEMDGFELLAYMSTNFPSIPAIVMSAYSTPDVKDRLKTMGSLRFIDKPVDFDELGQAIIDGLKEAPGGGSVMGISISSFLQLIEMEQKTCLLEVHPEDKSKKGFFYFNKGNLYDAVCGDVKGQEAALEIIAWDNAMITFKGLPKKRIRKRIDSELMSLLMEGMRLKDEYKSEEEGDSYETDALVEIGENDLLFDEDMNIGQEDDLSDMRGYHGTPEDEAAIDQSNGSLEEDVRDEESVLDVSEKTSTQVLQEIQEIPGINAAIVVARDGFVVEFTGAPGDIDMDMLGASVGMVLNGAERVRHELDMAEFQGLTLESDDAMIMCTPVGEALLVILAPDSKSLGIIRLRVKKQIPELERLF